MIIDSLRPERRRQMRRLKALQVPEGSATAARKRIRVARNARNSAKHEKARALAAAKEAAKEKAEG